MFNLLVYIVLLCDVQIKIETFSNLATNLKTGSRHM